MKKQAKQSGNVFVRMHPLLRILISLLMSGIVYLFVREHAWDWKLTSTLLWDVFAASFLLTSWIVLFTRAIPDIKKWANKDGGIWIFVMITILNDSL